MKAKKNIFSLQGKTIVITGGAGLIGKALVKASIELGAYVYCADIESDQIEKILRGCVGEYPGKALVLDITDAENVGRCVKTVIKERGRIEVWVNGAFPRTRDWGLKFEKIPVESWRKNIDMHLNGYFICCQIVAEVMKRQRAGSIINFGSIYGMGGPDFTIYKGTEMTSAGAYSAIKGGIINLTRYLASYYGRSNLRVNAISPGGIYDNQDPVFIHNYEHRCPMGRMGRSEDIIGAFLFLASDASAYVTGHNLVVDGGWTAI